MLTRTLILATALCLTIGSTAQARKLRLDTLQGNVYVVNSLDNTVSVIDTATNTGIATIHVGQRPTSIAVSPNAVYVGNANDNTVSIINPATNTVVNTIQVPYQPFGSYGVTAFLQCIALNPDGSRLYTANLDAGLAEIDTATSTMAFVGGSKAGRLASSPNGDVYVSLNDYKLGLFSHVTNAFTSQTISDYPMAFAVSPDSSTIYVLRFNVSNGNDEIAAISTSTNTETGAVSFPFGLYSDGIVVSPDSRTVYATDGPDNTVLVIDAATKRVTKTILVGKMPEGIAVDGNGFVYVVNRADNSMSVIDPATNIVVGVVAVGNGAVAAAVGPVPSNASVRISRK